VSVSLLTRRSWFNQFKMFHMPLIGFTLSSKRPAAGPHGELETAFFRSLQVLLEFDHVDVGNSKVQVFPQYFISCTAYQLLLFSQLK